VFCIFQAENEDESTREAKVPSPDVRSPASLVVIYHTTHQVHISSPLSTTTRILVRSSSSTATTLEKPAEHSLLPEDWQQYLCCHHFTANAIKTWYRNKRLEGFWQGHKIQALEEKYLIDRTE